MVTRAYQDITYDRFLEMLNLVTAIPVTILAIQDKPVDRAFRIYFYHPSLSEVLEHTHSLWEPIDARLQANLGKKLSTAEARVLVERFANSLTQEEVGKKFGVTRQRISQIQKKGLSKVGQTLKEAIDGQA